MERTTDRAQRDAWLRPGHATCDVLVVGGGAHGAAAYHHLVRAGLRTVLAEADDFAAGSSAGSAGLIWGGLLYLRHGHLGEVLRWCRIRDRLRHAGDGQVRALHCRYRRDPRRPAWLVSAALALYACCGGGISHRGRADLRFREAALTVPDARWTWHWIATAPARTAFNRLALSAVHWNGAHWQAQLDDRLNGGGMTLRCRWVVNAAGPWAAAIDRAHGIDHDWDLVLSRGVSLVVPPAGGDVLLREHPELDDVLSLAPFGPAAIWGSTETLVEDAATGFRVSPREAADLARWHRQCIGPLPRPAVRAVRCGVRAFARPRGAAAVRSQQAQRAPRVVADRHRPWLSVYGGKLASAAVVARALARRIAGRVTPLPALPAAPVPTVRMAGLDLDLPDPAWCRDHEQCWSLDDWLRRRTPVAQLVPRAGWGAALEHADALRAIAATLVGIEAADAALHRHAATARAAAEAALTAC